MKVGRKSKYESHIQPYLYKINEWLNNGATEKQVAENLGLSYPTWNRYKRDYKELHEVCSRPRARLVDDLKGALVKRALGCKIEEKKTYVTESDKDGVKKHTEITIKEIPPDPTAIFGALKIYDKNKLEYDIQAQNIDLKKQEIELRKEIAKNNNGEW